MILSTPIKSYNTPTNWQEITIISRHDDFFNMNNQVVEKGMKDGKINPAALPIDPSWYDDQFPVSFKEERYKNIEEH